MSTADDATPTIHLAMAIFEANTAVAVDISGGVELFECPTSIALDHDGRVELDPTGHGVRGFVSAIGDPYGLSLADGRLVRAEDLVAGFAHTLMRTMSELYALPADAHCTVVHPAALSNDAVAALRDALDYVGLGQCTLSAARVDDAALAARAASAGISSPSTTQTSDKAFAAMVADSAKTTPRRRARAGSPTRATVAVAAVAIGFLVIGGAVGTRDHLESGSVEPLNSQQAITPVAPVVTSPLVVPTTEPPEVQEAPVEVEEPVYVDVPDPVEAPEPPPVVVAPTSELGLPTDRFPFAPPEIDFPDFPTFPQPTTPPISTPTTTTTAPTTTASDTSSPPARKSLVNPIFPVSRP